MGLVILAGVILLSLILIVLGLPGLWIMVASAVAYNMVVPGDPIGWFTLVAVAVLGIIAEVLEFTMSGQYARKYGGSRRAGWGAIIGGIVGALRGLQYDLGRSSGFGGLMAPSPRRDRGSTAGVRPRGKRALWTRRSTVLRSNRFVIGFWSSRAMG